MSIEELYQLVRSNNVFYTRHAVQRMIERNITMEEVKQTVKNGW